jgi:hypothetical protein
MILVELCDNDSILRGGDPLEDVIVFFELAVEPGYVLTPTQVNESSIILAFPFSADLGRSEGEEMTG